MFFWKTEIVENTENKIENTEFFFSFFMPKKNVKNVNKTLKTENFYWKLYFTENLVSVDD